MNKTIQIDEEKCIGCGLCANVCKQSAIEIVGKKAKVVSEAFCDGIGNCLPVCPVGAIKFSGNEVNYEEKTLSTCNESIIKEVVAKEVTNESICSNLMQWPVQIKLVPENAPYFKNADLLIAADCTAYAYANFHNEFMKNKITIIGCPKLDDGNYSDKLTNIIKGSDIKSINVVKMEVPCCFGIENATLTAIKNSAKDLSCKINTISIKGTIVN